jgi:hypothetical protein
VVVVTFMGLARAPAARSEETQSPAAAQPLFGAARAIAFGGDVVIGAGYATDYGVGVALSFAPSLDVFVVPRLSLGLAVRGGFTRSPDGTSVVFALAPRAGYAVPLAARVFFWPQASLGPEWAYFAPAGIAPSANERRGAVGLAAPLLFVPTDHLAVGIGPRLEARFARTPALASGSPDGGASVALDTFVLGFF